jgi:hypothetical protein
MTRDPMGREEALTPERPPEDRGAPPAAASMRALQDLRHAALSAMGTEDHQAALRCGWRYMQHCAAGTLAFAEALSLVTDAAALAGHAALAEACAQAYLGHYRLLKAVAADEAAPLGLREPGAAGAQLLEELEGTFPVRAAVAGIESGQSIVWPRLVDWTTLGLPLGPQPPWFEPLAEAFKARDRRCRIAYKAWFAGLDLPAHVEL